MKHTHTPTPTQAIWALGLTMGFFFLYNKFFKTKTITVDSFEAATPQITSIS
jgi:hypothetical protein